MANWVRITVASFVVVAWFGWILNLIGLSLLQNECSETGPDATTDSLAQLWGGCMHSPGGRQGAHHAAEQHSLDCLWDCSHEHDTVAAALNPTGFSSSSSCSQIYRFWW
jgi:hypothetical protein